MTVIIFIIVLAVLIFVHELGHFLVARAFGIRVDEFALGFGPKLWSKTVQSAKHGETRYALNLVPFGGYVKIFGENPDEASISGPDSTRSFVNKPRPVQAAVLVAGVAFNFIFAAIIFSLVFMFGFPASIDSYPQYADRIHDSKVVITFVEPHSPASLAGLIAGDSIVSVGGAGAAGATSTTSTTSATSAMSTTSVMSVANIQNSIASSTGKAILLSYARGGNNHVATVTPALGIVEGKYAIGIAMADAGILQLPLHLAVWEGVRYTLHIISETAKGLWGLIVSAFHGDRTALASVTGPVGIAGLVGDAVHLGFSYLLVFTALISVNLGVLNLVPFPALDGGRLLFVIIESIIRRRIKPSFANIINTVGFGLLILLMVVVTYRDIAKLFVK